MHEGTLARKMAYRTVVCLASMVVPLVNSGTPSNCSVDIVGPESFPTDGTKDLTLRASTRNLGDSPDFTWRGCPSYSDTCVFRPQIDQDGNEVLCTARNPDNNEARTAKYVLNLTYPPSEAPKIVNNATREVLSSGDTLSPGDTLTCTVSGGKPLVTSVSFSCTNPSGSLPDQDDVSNATSVSSSLTVDVSMATGGLMVCTCTAEWSTNPSLYQNETTMNFYVEGPSSTERPKLSTENPKSSTDKPKSLTNKTPSPTDESTPPSASENKAVDVGVVVGVGLGGVTLVVVVVVIVILFMRRRKIGCFKEGTESATAQKEHATGTQTRLPFVPTFSSGSKGHSGSTAGTHEPPCGMLPAELEEKLVTNSSKNSESSQANAGERNLPGDGAVSPDTTPNSDEHYLLGNPNNNGPSSKPVGGKLGEADSSAPATSNMPVTGNVQAGYSRQQRNSASSSSSDDSMVSMSSSGSNNSRRALLN